MADPSEMGGATELTASRRTPTGTVSFYVGEFLVYHPRRITTSSYYGGPMPAA